MYRVAIFVCFSIAAISPYQQWRNIYQKITREPEFSGFNSMIKNHRIAKLNLNYAAMTVFVPENSVIDDYDGEFTEDLVLYHMAFEVRTIKMFNESASFLFTAHSDNPPLWITLQQNKEVYVNNAKILQGRSNYMARSQGDQSKLQALHVIDRVLDPMVHTPHPNATAYTFLQNYQKWKIGRRSIQEYYHKVQQYHKEDLYRKSGGHTFFIPVDHKMDDYQLENIDSYIIEGHVVPNVVLFTRPTQNNFIYETAANGDYVYIVMSMNTTQGRTFVKSYTMLGNSAHKKGEVVAEVVKSDIPVLNGVVHLIKQPLAVFKRELKPFPYLSVFYKISADPDLSRAYEIGTRAGLDSILKNESLSLAYFVPRNKAWRHFLHYDPDQLADMLGRHIAVTDGRLTSTKLAMKGTKTILNTLSGPIEISFDQSKAGSYIVLGQKKIAVHRADYECTNGVVHLVDDLFAEAQPPSTPSGFWKKLKDWVA